MTRSKKTLSGKSVVLTRTAEGIAAARKPLEALGARVLEIPLIAVNAGEEKLEHDEVLEGIAGYDWIIFTSHNGVRAFFGYFFKQFHDLRDLGGARIAAIGPGTAQALKDLHLQVDLMPDEALGMAVAAAFEKYQSVENLKICILRAEVANPELPRALESLGAIVDDVPCYKTVADTEDLSGAAAQLAETGADWITFTSASTVVHFNQRFDLPVLVRKFPGIRLASIGPETTKALAELGLQPHVEAKEHTIDGLVEALLKASA